MKRYLSARDLPEQWDEGLGGNPYLARSFLRFIESVDDSEKAYYSFEGPDGSLDTRLMMHKRRGYNLTMFSSIATSIEMNFVYFPLSVSRPAILHGEASKGEVAAFLKSLPGYKMILNVPATYRLDGFARGLTCPRCVLDVDWPDFDAYLRALRHGYRRRYTKALAKSRALTLSIQADNSEFDEALYALYEEVYENSRYKLEKLPLAFFRGDMFTLLVLRDRNGPVGFAQLLANGPELIFEFVGFCHARNREYDIYLRLLLEIVRFGIEHGFRTIDFGQTADDAKLKLGCRYEMLHALLHHSNPVLNAFLRLFAGFLQYKPLDADTFHVFRQEG